MRHVGPEPLIRALLMAARHVETGEWGENHAARMLRKKGYKILGERIRLGPRDEIDIVAREGKTVVFVEVKTRKSEGFGRPRDSVDRKKRHVLSRAAVRYLKRAGFPEGYHRFDIVEVIGTMEEESPIIRHIENAFTLDRRYTLPY